MVQRNLAFGVVLLVGFACSQSSKDTDVADEVVSASSALGDGSPGNPFTGLTELTGVSTGDYSFQIGGGAVATGSVDSTVDGGGWLLVLNYVHQGGTNPVLSILSSTFPLLGSSSLGDDESTSTPNWGHAGNAWLAALRPTEFRFFGQSPTATIHFTTKNIGLMSYAVTGDATMQWALQDGATQYTTQSGHGAVLPGTVNAGFRDQGDQALTEFPFYESGARTWGIRGQGTRWEVDDNQMNFAVNTIHRVWVRRQCADNYGPQVALMQATADHEQSSFLAAEVLDGTYSGSTNGWAVGGALGMDHMLSLQTVSDLGAAGVPMTVQFRLHQNWDNGDTMIGRFRLSYTTNDRSTFGAGNGPIGTATFTPITSNGASPEIFELISSRSSAFAPQSDESVLMSGGNSSFGGASPDDDAYFVKATFTPAGPVTGFLLETLADASLPSNGPGRHANGNFVLSEFEVRDLPCGDGCVDPDETCDDGNLSGGDGCDNICAVETGWQCTGTPSVCTEICGDGIVVGAEVCDDNNTAAGDGCSSTCTLETGFTCMGAPSTCTAICGDGLVKGSEGCDDSGTTGGDGCSATCAVETGYGCMGEPSTCSTVCGDGILAGTEACDDSGTMAGDGCSATCTLEAGFSCMGMPSMCSEVCGDGMVVGSEGCDDGGTAPGDGCSATCTVEMGYMCAGAPSMCMMIGGGDAGMGDGGMSDGGMGDAGMSDGGVADSGMTDSGMGDGGSDAGVGDGGVVADGGLSDGGVVADGGLSDGGAVADGNVDTGVDPGTGGSSGGGCGCSVGDTRPAHREMLGAALLMLGVGFGLRRRRRR